MQKENLEQQIENQLKRFEQAVGEDVFVRDGIVDVAKYLKAPIKILWILKEANSPKNDLPDMRPNLASLIGEIPNIIDPKWAKTWRPIVRCVYGIFENKGFEYIKTMDDEVEIVEYMKKVAHINVKKYAGGSKAQETEMKNFYKKYKDFLHEQIEIINPDVLIFGGTFHYFDEDYFAGKNQIKTWRPIFQWKNKLLIDTFHPVQSQISAEEYCDEIINAVRKWKQEMQK